MEISVRDAAAQLRIDESRVRRMLRDRDLVGHRMGGMWLVNADDVARRVAFALPSGHRPGGRPMSARRAWGLLDLLDGGHAVWLSPSDRSQVRAQVRKLTGADAARWRAALRARSEIVPAAGHPAAVGHLGQESDVRRAGPSEAAAQGLNLLVLHERPELYVRPEAWPALQARYGLRVSPRDPALLIHLPRDGWWPSGDRLSALVLAADLLEHPEPRGVSAAVALLNERAARVGQAR
jgi:excisionase family DNA binding protein